MSCPACGCKETYQYSDTEDFDINDELMRCAACGEIFDLQDEIEEDDYWDSHGNSGMKYIEECDTTGGETDCESKKLNHEPSEKCWCNPEKVFVDPETGNDVFVHREIQ